MAWRIPPNARCRRHAADRVNSEDEVHLFAAVVIRALVRVLEKEVQWRVIQRSLAGR